jgi:hypothetical protein
MNGYKDLTLITDHISEEEAQKMEDFLARIFENLIDRVSGPMKFRLILQPLIAIIFAVRAGLKDAKEGKVPYNWALISDRDHRRDLLRSGWKSVGKVFVIAILIDLVYQWIVFDGFTLGKPFWLLPSWLLSRICWSGDP